MITLEYMICLQGEAEQHAYLPEISNLGAGIELGSYGLVGIKSWQDWKARFAKHKAIADKFQGKLAIHGPFLGIEYAHIDHLLCAAIQKRMDMTFNTARNLKASRVILHSGYRSENEIFQLDELWVNGNINYWKQEIKRWERAGIEVVLENDVEKDPELLVHLIEMVNSPSLQLCLDVGHLHYLSSIAAPDWVKRMGAYLKHVHIHDNDRKADHHWPIGKGTFDFEAFFSSIETCESNIILSIEIEDTMEVKINDLRKVMNRFKR